MNIYKYGNKIRELRTGMNLTQQQLADKLNVSAKTVSHWETGYTLPDMEMMMKLSEVFNVSLNDMVSENSDIPTQQVAEEYSQQYTRSQGRISRLNRFQKAVLIFVTVISVVFTIAYIVVTSKEGFLYKNTIFTPAEESGTKTYSGKIADKPAVFTINGNTLTFTCGDDTYGPYAFREDPSAIPENHSYARYMTGVEITQGDHLVFRGGVTDIGLLGSGNNVRILFNEDGSVADNTSSADTVSLNPTPADIVELMLGPRLTHKGEIGAWFAGFIFCLLTAISILFEKELFRWHLSFRIRDPEHAEPSDWEMFGRYVSWAIIPILALQLFIIGLQ